MKCTCGAVLPVDSRYSICSSCLYDPYDDQRADYSEYDDVEEDYDDE